MPSHTAASIAMRMYMLYTSANSSTDTRIARTISTPPIVGVLDLWRVSSLRSAWSNSGRSPSFFFIRKRMSFGPSTTTSRKLIAPAPVIRSSSPFPPSNQ